MNARLTVYLTLCTIALTPRGASAELVHDDTYRKNERAFYEIDQEVAAELNSVMAKCRLDLDQYLDEHPELSVSRTQDVIYERTSLCMQASGYPAGPPKPTDGAGLPSTLLPVCRFGTQTLADESGGQRPAETFNGWTSTSAKAYTADGLRVVRASERGLQRSGGVMVVVSKPIHRDVVHLSPRLSWPIVIPSRSHSWLT